MRIFDNSGKYSAWRILSPLSFTKNFVNELTLVIVEKKN